MILSVKGFPNSVMDASVVLVSSEIVFVVKVPSSSPGLIFGSVDL